MAFDPARANEVGKIHEKPYFDVEKLQASLNGEEETPETSTAEAEAETDEAVAAEVTEAEEATEDATEEASEVTETTETEAPAESTVSFDLFIDIFYFLKLFDRFMIMNQIFASHSHKKYSAIKVNPFW